MYYSPLTSDYLYSIETTYLRANPNNDTLAAKRAFDNVKNLGQRGGNANGFSGDSLGNVYMLMPENNAIYIYKYASQESKDREVADTSLVIRHCKQSPMSEILA